jgi:D-3-phosphoglycerate dehydrogenase
MPAGALFINTARAEIVDEAALYEVAKEGRIAVGTDVLSGEPQGKAGDFTHRLASLPNVYVTHHIGASTDQAQRKVAKAAAAIVVRYLETGIAENTVNVNVNPPIQGMIEVRHLDKVGVLADVLGVLERAEINVETMENVVFTGGVGACARIRVSRRPDDGVVRALTGVEHVLGVDLS